MTERKCNENPRHQCPLCGKIYVEHEDCMRCMGSHLEATEIIDTKYENNKSFVYNVPTDICIKMSNGKIQWYRKA